MSMDNLPKWAGRACVAGAFFALAGAAIVSNFDKPDKGSKESQSAVSQTREKVRAVLGGNKGVVGAGGEDPPRFAQIKIIDIVRSQARNGGGDAAAFLMNYYDERMNELLNPSDEHSKHVNLDEIHQNLLNELDISEEEYKLFRMATEFRDRMALLDNNDGEFDDLVQRAEDSGVVMMGAEQDQATIISSVQLQGLLRLLCTQAGSPGGAFDPQFLSLIGKTPQELKDLAQQIYSYYENAGQEEKEPWKEYLEYLRYHYGLAGE